ncbi:SphA family protein [Pseudomonas guariconensis]|uniref:SphA family protein n=1 Tax=Pseudomonas guariconensis TaxID=1288410 RepID=UPI0018A945A6|nr:transporter [Pseudomonas guariconensis]MBF8721787.1 transporter [Pseudomonas guariconensis]
MQVRSILEFVKSSNYTALMLAGALAMHPIAASANERIADLSQLGSFSFGGGFLPPPGSTSVALAVGQYKYDKIAGDDGHMIQPLKKVDVTVNSGVLAILHMTDQKLLGADYGFRVLFPYMDITGDADVNTPFGSVKSDIVYRDLIDVVVTPVMLQWRDPSRTFNQNFSVNIEVPIGTYDKKSFANSGRDNYSIEPMYAFTYMTPTGFEFSSSFALRYNFRNRNDGLYENGAIEGRYKNGSTFAWNFATGQHVGPFTVGISGYALEQLTDDKIDGGQAPENGKRSRVYAVGPAVSFRDYKNPKMPVLSVKYLKEFGAENRSQGEILSLIAAYTF